jgi:hypothetical protein
VGVYGHGGGGGGGDATKGGVVIVIVMREKACENLGFIREVLRERN